MCWIWFTSTGIFWDWRLFSNKQKGIKMRQIRKIQGKRIIGAVLALFLMLSCVMIPDTQAKAENMIIALSSKSVKIGDTLTVTVTLPAGVTGTVNLTYSKDVFTYKSASAEASVNAGTVVMTLGSYGANNKRATGTVTFQADAAGSASFAASAPSAGNQEGDRVSVGGASVAVTVENAAAESDQKSSDASLAELTLSEGMLSPAFQASVTEYTADVDNSVTSIAVSAKPKDASASVVSVSGADALKEGKNSIKIVVQAQNGVKQTYTITVTRKAAQKTEEPQTQTTEETKETQTDTQEQMYFTLDSAKLYPADTIPDRYVPQGFSKDTVTLWGKDYPCLVRDGADTPIRILYLTDADGQNGALYLLDMDVPEEIYPFVCMNYAQYMHTINSDTTAEQPSTQDGGELFGDTKSQMNLILSAFVVVVLILVIIIIVLIVKKKGGDDDDDDYYDYDDDEDDEDDDEDELDVPDILYGNRTSGPSKRYEEGTFRKKGGFLNKLLDGIDDDDDDDYDDDEDDDGEAGVSGDEPEESAGNIPFAPQKEQKEPEVPLEDEDDLLQEELAKEVKSSLLGRKKPVNRSKEDDDIEFIDL